MNDVDVVVIGSGAGGLAAAVALARTGRSVLVLEQHYLPGGWCHSFSLEGYRFSPGVHYIGELGPDGAGRRLFEGLGLGADLTFYELNPDAFEHLIIGGERFDIPKGRERYEERLARRFPRERLGIHAYLETLVRLQRELVPFLGASRLRDVGRAALQAPTMLRWGLATGRGLVDHHVKDPLLRAIFSAQAGDHGLPLSRVSAAVHAGVAAHYLDGGWYPRGGGHALPRAFLRALKRAGGSVRLRSEVSRILLEGDRAVGVRLADGTEIRAGAVVSNADPAVTFGRLVGREHLPGRLVRKLDRTRWSLSAMSLFFAAEIDAEALGLDSGNLWYYASPHIDGIYEQAYDPRSLDLERLPGFFLTVTTLKDPSKRYGRRHTLEAFSLLTGDAFARWAGTRSGDRPPDYEALKQAVGDRMLRSIDEVVPGLASRVVFRAVGTPLSNVHYIAATNGSLYGTEKTRSQVGPFTYGARTPFRDLYLCGASTLSHGVMGAALSGLVAAKAVSHVSVEELLAKGGPPVVTRSAELTRRERAAAAEADVVEPEDLELEAAAPGA